jgi:hypothetical protein
MNFASERCHKLLTKCDLHWTACVDDTLLD